MSAQKSMPLTKEEVMQLVQLVAAHPDVYNKATNASSNQLKDATWAIITDKFNATITSSPRRAEQLRLKWENLKKAARKRSTKIRMNNLKTGGGKPEYIPPDEVLDQVAAILGPTCNGYSVQFGGDSVEVAEDMVVEELVEEVAVVNVPFDPLDTPFNTDHIPPRSPIPPAITPHTTPQSKKFYFNSAKSRGKVKRQAVTEDVKASIIKKNTAVANYYDARRENEAMILALKKKKMELKILQMEKDSLCHKD